MNRKKGNFKRLMSLMIATAMFLIVLPPMTADCPTDIVSYWKLDEGSGTTATDDFNGNPGTIYGDPDWVDGMVGKALSFDGSGDYIEIPDDDSLSFVDGDPDESFSVSAWVYMRNYIKAQRFVGKADSLASGYGEYLLTTNGASKFAFYLSDASVSGYSFIGRYWDGTPSLNQWYHLVGTYDGSGEISGIKLYVDGVRVDNTDSTLGPYEDMENTDIPVYLGYYPQFSDYLDGMLDEVAIWNKELTSDEISDIYCLGSNGIGYTDDLEYSGALLQTSNSVTLEATLTDPSDNGVDGCDITFYLNDIDVGSATTNANGVATLYVGAKDSGVYEVYASVCCIGSDLAYITINDPPIANANGPYTGIEGSPIIFDATGSSDLDGDSLSYSWDLDNNGDFDDATGATPSYTWYDDYSGIVSVQVSDDFYTDTSSSTVIVSNVAPTITSLELPMDPLQIGAYVDLTADFTDPGTIDTHTATIDWGDGNTSSASIIGSDGIYTATDSWMYGQSGVYTITTTVTDDDDGIATEIYQYVVVYDPNAGFVTGGGWIYSPAGAFTEDETLEGKANFGFVSKYKKGQENPTGNTQFKFEIANLDFHSTSYDWLVIAGAKAMYKGVGTINDEGEYKFIISAIDGDLKDDEVDKFRIKIWGEDENGDEIVIYDNEIGDEEDSDPTTEISGGQIKIHKK